MGQTGKQHDSNRSVFMTYPLPPPHPPTGPQERAKTVRKAAKRLAQTLQMTKFAMAPMVAVAAKVSGGYWEPGCRGGGRGTFLVGCGWVRQLA